jgi:hypothetical protein
MFTASLCGVGPQGEGGAKPMRPLKRGPRGVVDARILYDDGPKFLEKMPSEQAPVRKKRDEKTVVTVTIF